jgi:hypothetical protein
MGGVRLVREERRGGARDDVTIRWPLRDGKRPLGACPSRFQHHSCGVRSVRTRFCPVWFSREIVFDLGSFWFGPGQLSLPCSLKLVEIVKREQIHFFSSKFDNKSWPGLIIVKRAAEELSPDTRHTNMAGQPGKISQANIQDKSGI